MRVLVLFVLLSGYVYSQVTATEAKLSEEELDRIAQQFVSTVLDRATWTKVSTSADRTEFFVDVTSLTRDQNRVEFYFKADKRGNLSFYEASGNCLTDSIYFGTFWYRQNVGEPTKALIRPSQGFSGIGTASPGTVGQALLSFACEAGSNKNDSTKEKKSSTLPDEPIRRVANFLEVASDQPGFVGKVVKTTGLIEISMDYERKYEDAQTTHFAFKVSDSGFGNWRGTLYMKRGKKADDLRSQILTSKGGILQGSFTFIIYPDRFDPGWSRLNAELIEYDSPYSTAIRTTEVTTPSNPLNPRATSAPETTPITNVVDQLLLDETEMANLLGQRDDASKVWTRERISKELKVQKYDLNGDGEPEYVIWGSFKLGFCGSGGCSIWIYQKAATGFRSLLSGTDPVGNFSLAATRTSGYSDLLLSTRDGAYEEWVSTYKFIAGVYVDSGCFKRIYRNNRGIITKRPMIRPCE